MLQAVLGLIVLASQAAATPFWRAKERVYDKIQNREIIVSVSGPTGHLQVSGGGQIARSCAYTIEKSRDMKAAALSTGYIDRAEFDSQSQILKAHVKAYGLTAHIEMKMEMDEKKDPPTMAFRVLKGPLPGMTGSFEFFKVAAKKCDVGVDGTYKYEKFPLPAFFLKFGLEVMFQRMAGAIRRYVEEKAE
ncbi:MAG: hypothetical protein AB7F86_01240 [Bdellovibrionales bacterium]